MPPRSRFIWSDLFRPGETSHRPLARILGENVLFKTLSGRELTYLSTQVHERVYEKGETIFEQDERGMGMYVIASGRVSIRERSGPAESVIATLEGGSFFGELALIEADSRRSASAVALERSTLIGFFKPDLFDILERKPEMGVKLLLQLSRVLGVRLVASNETRLVPKVASGEVRDEVAGDRRQASG
jgi:CRP-like cAMP-binding protein